MNERYVESVFTKHKKELLKALGKGALYDDQISKIGFANIPKFQGVYASDAIPKKKGYYIINTGNSKSPGIHWVGLIRTAKHDYVYDSFARKTGHIVRSLAGSGRVVESDRTDIEQKDDKLSERTICGQLSLAWLLTARDLGINSALKV